MAGAFQRIGLQELLCCRIIFQVRVPESQRSGVGIPQNCCSLRRASGVCRFCRDERHVTRALDEHFIFVTRLAVFEWNFVPRYTRQRPQIVKRASYAHKGQ